MQRYLWCHHLKTQGVVRCNSHSYCDLLGSVLGLHCFNSSFTRQVHHDIEEPLRTQRFIYVGYGHVVSELKNMGYGRDTCDITVLRSASCIVEFFSSSSSSGLLAFEQQTRSQLSDPSGTVCGPCPRRAWPTSSSNSLKAHTLKPLKRHSSW